jgi:hypothetical protein
MFAAIRRASSLVSSLAAERRTPPHNRHTRAFARALSLTTKQASNSSTDHGGGKRRLFSVSDQAASLSIASLSAVDSFTST